MTDRTENRSSNRTNNCKNQSKNQSQNRTENRTDNRTENRASTGFECLLGWLYLTGRKDRVEELFDKLWEDFDPNQK